MTPGRSIRLGACAAQLFLAVAARGQDLPTNVLARAAAAPATLPATIAVTAPEFEVAADPRIELLCTVYRLAGHPEYNTARIVEYAAAVDTHFAPFKDHDAVRLCRQLKRARFDAAMSLAVHLSPPPDLALLVPLEPWPATLDTRWRDATLADFLTALRRFYVDSHFAEFLAAQRDLHTLTAQRLRQTLSTHARLDWFPRFFGPRADSGPQFHLVPALLNGQTNYGPSVRLPGGEEHLYCVLSVWSRDPTDRLPRFPSRVTPTIVHEFTHPSVNPLVDAHYDEIATAAEAFFRRHESDLRRRGYSNPQTAARESLVRACVVRYLADTVGSEAATAEIQAQASLGFANVPSLAGSLAQFESHREQYPTLESYMPRLLDAFGEKDPIAK